MLYVKSCIKTKKTRLPRGKQSVDVQEQWDKKGPEPEQVRDKKVGRYQQPPCKPIPVTKSKSKLVSEPKNTPKNNTRKPQTTTEAEDCMPPTSKQKKAPHHSDKVTFTFSDLGKNKQNGTHQPNKMGRDSNHYPSQTSETKPTDKNSKVPFSFSDMSKNTKRGDQRSERSSATKSKASSSGKIFQVALGMKKMVNRWTNCWFNSSVQALMATNVSNDILAAPEEIFEPHTRCIVTLLRQYKNTVGQQVKPESIDKALEKVTNQYTALRYKRQNDAHEFFNAFMGSVMQVMGKNTLRVTQL